MKKNPRRFRLACLLMLTVGLLAACTPSTTDPAGTELPTEPPSAADELPTEPIAEDTEARSETEELTEEMTTEEITTEEVTTEAETDEQKAHVEKSSIQIYYYCHLVGPNAQRVKNLKKVYELCEKYGIEYYKYVIPMPDASNNSNLNSLL